MYFPLLQIILETKALDAARARYQKEQLSAIARGQAAALPEARQMLLRWFGPVTAAIQKEQQRVRRGVGISVWYGSLVPTAEGGSLVPTAEGGARRCTVLGSRPKQVASQLPPGLQSHSARPAC